MAQLTPYKKIDFDNPDNKVPLFTYEELAFFYIQGYMKALMRPEMDPEYNFIEFFPKTNAAHTYDT